MSGLGALFIILMIVGVLMRQGNKSSVAVTPAFTTAESPRYRFSVSVKKKDGWKEWRTMNTSAPSAEVGAVLGGYAAFMVVPVFLGNINPSLDQLATVLLGLMDFESPGGRVSVERGTATGLEYHLERASGSTRFLYRLQVLVSGRFAYLLAVWVDVNHSAGKKKVFSILDAVDIRPDSGEPFDPPVDELPRNRQARVLNDTGILCFRGGNMDRAADCFRQSLTYKQDAVYLSNLVSILIRMQQFDKARAVLADCGDRFSDNGEIIAHQALLAEQAGQQDDAVTSFARLFELGSRNVEHLTRYTRLLWDMGRKEEAYAAIRRFHEGGVVPDAQLLEASLLIREQDYERASQLLRQVHTVFPGNVEASLDLADCLLRSGDFSGCLSACEELIQSRNDSAVAYYLKGRAEHAMGKLGEARTSLQEAQSRNPAAPEIKNLLDHVTGLLGKSSTQGISNPIDAVGLPEGIALQKNAADDTFAGDHGAYYVDCIKSISMNLPDDVRYTDYLVLKVTGSRGLSIYSTFMVPYDPFSEAIYVNELTVCRPDGSILEGNRDDYYVLDDRSENIASQKKMLHIPVPGLAAGAVLHLVITRRNVWKNTTVPFHMHMFSCRVPTLRSALFVKGAQTSLRARLFPDSSGSTDFQNGEWRGWIYANPACLAVEPHMKPPVYFLPSAWLGEASASWEHLADSYLTEMEEVLQPESRSREVVERILQGVTDRDDRINSILQFLQDNVRYTALEFGTRGQKPNPVSEILSEGYGDCKDHSVLALHLLRAVGISSSLALVHTSNPIVEEIPSMDQFNHMILYLEEEKRFLDCVGKNGPINIPVPGGLGGRMALVLRSGRSELLRIPPHDLCSSRLTVKRSVSLKGIHAEVEERVELDGYIGAFLRSSLQQRPPEARLQLFQDLITGAGLPPRLIGADVENLDGGKAALMIHLRYETQAHRHDDRSRVALIMPAPWEHTYLSFRQVQDRKTPFEVPFPCAVVSEVSVRSADGLRPAEIPEPISARNEFVDWSFAALSPEDGSLQVRYNCQLFAQDGEPGDYDSFQSSTDAALGCWRSPLVFVQEQGA